MKPSVQLTSAIAGVTSGIVELQRQLEEAQKAAIRNELNDVITLLLTELDLPGLYVHAWTPGFNDGDPCEHCMEIGRGHFYKSDDTWEAEGTDSAQFDTEDDRDLAKQACIELSKKDGAMEVVESLIDPLEDALQSAFGTDWFLFWKLKDDGTVELKHGYNEVDY